MTDTTKRYLGKIIIPESGLKYSDVWLSILDNRIYIELPSAFDNKEQWNVLWGEFNSLGTITLLECRLNSSIDGFGGNHRKIMVHKIVQGEKLKARTDKFLNEISLDCSALMNWINIDTGFKLSTNNVTIPDKYQVFKIKTNEFTLVGHICFNRTYGYALNEYTFRRVFLLNVSFNSSKNISEFYKWKAQFEKLIVFLTNLDPNLSILGINNSHHKIFGIDSNWKESSFLSNLELKYTDVESSLSALFNFWFDEKKLKPIVELLSEKKMNPSLSIPRHFLNMCVAYESFHDSFIGKNLKDKEAILKKMQIKKLLEDQVELADWFDEVTRYVSKIDFIDKLKSESLYPEYKILIANIFGIDSDDLMQMIKSTRNKLAHEGRHDTHFNKEFHLYLVAFSIELFLQYQIIKCVSGSNIDLLKRANEHLHIFGVWNDFKGIAKFDY